MKLRRRTYLLLAAGAAAALGLWFSPLGAEKLSIADRIELAAHARLMAVRDEAPANAFTTDGCSGGMSNIWRGLTATFPDLATDIGAHPPWESCCITHDQAYHIAGNATTARASFDARLTADETLRECVAATQTDLSPQTQQALADAMFHAVRTGGGPCTGLPWRWGYGLPRCIGFFQ